MLVRYSNRLVILWFMLVSGSVYANNVIDLPDCSFKYSVSTTASRATVWRLWSDVENWKKFDTLLEYSYLLDGAEFAQGATGYVKAEGAPKTKFELTRVIPLVSFVETLKLPFYHSLELERYFESSDNGETVFVHQVNFKGPMRSLVYWIAADTFKKELPLVMGKLKKLAESEETLRVKSSERGINENNAFRYE